MPKAKPKRKAKAARKKPGNKPGSNGGGGRRVKADPFTTPKELEKLKSLAASGIRISDIAGIYQMSRTTLYELMKHNPDIRTYIDMGKSQALYNVAQTLYSKAISGDLTAAIFYLKTRGGWKDESENQGANMQSVRIVLPGQQSEQVISIGPPEQVIDAEADDGATDK